MAEITITIKIDDNAVTIAQESIPSVHVIQTQPQGRLADGNNVVAKRRLPRIYNDQSGGENPGDTTP